MQDTSWNKRTKKWTMLQQMFCYLFLFLDPSPSFSNCPHLHAAVSGSGVAKNLAPVHKVCRRFVQGPLFLHLKKTQIKQLFLYVSTNGIACKCVYMFQPTFVWCTIGFKHITTILVPGLITTWKSNIKRYVCFFPGIFQQQQMANVLISPN